jgi:hypothetical protein
VPGLPAVLIHPANEVGSSAMHGAGSTVSPTPADFFRALNQYAYVATSARTLLTMPPQLPLA